MHDLFSTVFHKFARPKKLAMREMRMYTIPFSGLKLGKHHFDYDLDASFFEHFDYSEFSQADIHVDIEFNKKNTMLELAFTASGTVRVACDLSNEMYDQPIDGGLDLVVKFGEEFNDEDMDMLILPHGAYEVNVSQYIYELVVLALPNKLVHPGVADGTLQSEVLDKLQQLQPGEAPATSDDEEETTDPRWNELKKLLDN